MRFGIGLQLRPDQRLGPRQQLLGGDRLAAACRVGDERVHEVEYRFLPVGQSQCTVTLPRGRTRLPQRDGDTSQHCAHDGGGGPRRQAIGPTNLRIR